MSELNATFMKEIMTALNATRFSSDDFDLDEPVGDELLVLKFKYDNRHNFHLQEEEVTEEVTTGISYGLNSEKHSKTVTKLFTYESPGRFKVQDKKQIRDFGGVSERISLWCQNIHREMSNEGSYDQVMEKAKEDFKEGIKLVMENPDEKFSKEEVEKLSRKMDELYEKIDNLSEKYELSERELKALKNELNLLKDSAKTYKKGVWARIAENKISNYVFDFLKSKEGRGLIIDSIKKIGSGM